MIHWVFPSFVETFTLGGQNIHFRKAPGFQSQPAVHWLISQLLRVNCTKMDTRWHGERAQADRGAHPAASVSKHGCFPGRMLSRVWRALAAELIEENVTKMSGQEQF